MPLPCPAHRACLPASTTAALQRRQMRGPSGLALCLDAWQTCVECQVQRQKSICICSCSADLMGPSWQLRSPAACASPRQVLTQARALCCIQIRLSLQNLITFPAHAALPKLMPAIQHGMASYTAQNSLGLVMTGALDWKGACVSCSFLSVNGTFVKQAGCHF